MNPLALPDDLVESLSEADLAELLEDIVPQPRFVSVAYPEPYRPPQVNTLSSTSLSLDEHHRAMGDQWGRGQTLGHSLIDRSPIPPPLIPQPVEQPIIPNGIVHFKAIAPRGQYSKLVDVIPFQERMWGNTPLKRLVCQLSREEINGIPLLEEIIQRSLTSPVINSLVRGRSFSGAWLNLYRDGQDYTPHHQDSYDADVLMISIGGTRRFLTKEKGTGTPRARSWECDDGDIIIFTPEFNSKHTHSIPKTAQVVDPRISIVLFLQ